MNCVEELFEVIDENGKVIGLKPRSEVHAAGLRHKGVYLLILDSEGRIFVQQRANDKDLMPSAWDLSVAEHLKPGESFKDACFRGAREELNVKVWNPKFLGEIDFYFKYPDGKIDHELNQVFVGEFTGEIEFQDKEVQGGKFMEIQDLLREMGEEPEKFTPWIMEYKKFIESVSTR